MKVKVKNSKLAIIKKTLITWKLTKAMLIIKPNKIYNKRMDKMRQKKKRVKVKSKMENNKLLEILIIQKKMWNKMKKMGVLKIP